MEHMIGLVVVAVFASTVFYRTASENGRHAVHAACVPWIGLIGILILEFLLAGGIVWVLSFTDIAEAVVFCIDVFASLFVWVVYLIFLRENLKAISGGGSAD